MKIGQPLWAVVDADGEILGTGDAPALYTSMPDKQEIELVKQLSRCDAPRVVRVTITRE